MSLSVAAPMIINDMDTDVEELTLEDFPDEKPETAHYLIAQASLSRAGMSSPKFAVVCLPFKLSIKHILLLLLYVTSRLERRPSLSP